MPRGVEVRGSVQDPGVPRALFGANGFKTTGVPAPAKKYGRRSVGFSGIRNQMSVIKKYACCNLASPRPLRERVPAGAKQRRAGEGSARVSAQENDSCENDSCEEAPSSCEANPSPASRTLSRSLGTLPRKVGGEERVRYKAVTFAHGFR